MGCGIWLVNLYFFQNLQIIQTFYLMRFFSLLHPLIIVFTISTVISYLTLDSSYAERSILFLVALTPMIFSPVFALILVTTSVAFIEKRQWSILLFLALNAGYFGLLLYGSPLEIKRLLPFILNAILYLRVSNSFNGYQVFVFLIFLFLLFEYKFPKSSIRIENSRVVIVSCIGIIFVGIFLLAKPGWQRFKQADYNFNLLFNFNPSDYWGVRESDRNYSELLDWVKESPYKIFTVPPYNDKFLSFRFLTGKGVYIFHRDIAQLMYSPKYYIKAIKRLVEVAGNSPELPKAFMSGEIVRGNGDYEKNCLYLLESSDYDAVIFDRRQLIIEYCGSEKSIFQNSNYVVFKAKGNLLEKEPDANVDVRAP